MAASVQIPVDLDKSSGRSTPGAIPSIRREVSWQLFQAVDPDLLHKSEPPPPHMQMQLEEVFGKERCRGVKLARHPLLGFWCLWEAVHDPAKGQIGAWRVVSMFYTKPVEGYLPHHLRGKKYAAHVTGQVGDPRLPTRKDFEIIERFDRKKYGAEAVEAEAARPELAAELEQDRVFDDYITDWLDYHFWLAMRDAQAHHSRPWSTATIEVHPNGGRFAVFKKDGYNYRVKWGSKEHKAEMEVAAAALEEKIQEIANELAALKADRAEFAKARGLRREFTVQDWLKEKEDIEAAKSIITQQQETVALEEAAEKNPTSVEEKVREWHLKQQAAILVKR